MKLLKVLGLRHSQYSINLNDSDTLVKDTLLEGLLWPLDNDLEQFMADPKVRAEAIQFIAADTTTHTLLEKFYHGGYDVNYGFAPKDFFAFEGLQDGEQLSAVTHVSCEIYLFIFELWNSKTNTSRFVVSTPDEIAEEHTHNLDWFIKSVS